MKQPDPPPPRKIPHGSKTVYHPQYGMLTREEWAEKVKEKEERGDAGR